MFHAFSFTSRGLHIHVWLSFRPKVKSRHINSNLKTTMTWNRQYMRSMLLSGLEHDPFLNFGPCSSFVVLVFLLLLCIYGMIVILILEHELDIDSRYLG